MMAISGSGWSAMGSTSFWSCAALFLAGADGGGAGFAAGAEAAEAPALAVWHLTVPMLMREARAKIRQAFMGSLGLLPRMGGFISSSMIPEPRAECWRCEKVLLVRPCPTATGL